MVKSGPSLSVAAVVVVVFSLKNVHAFPPVFSPQSIISVIKAIVYSRSGVKKHVNRLLCDFYASIFVCSAVDSTIFFSSAESFYFPFHIRQNISEFKFKSKTNKRPRSKQLQS